MTTSMRGLLVRRIIVCSTLFAACVPNRPRADPFLGSWRLEGVDCNGMEIGKEYSSRIRITKDEVQKINATPGCEATETYRAVRYDDWIDLETEGGTLDCRPNPCVLRHRW